MAVSGNIVPTNPASPLSDIIRCVVSIFQLVADPTPIQVGKQYLRDFGVGSAPRVLFVPDSKGKDGQAPAGSGGVGYIGWVAHGCQVYVRGAESGDDIGRFDAAYALADRVVNAVERAGRSRLDWVGYKDFSPTAVDAYGADLAFSFVYTRGIQCDEQIWALRANPIAKSPPDIGRPPGAAQSTVGSLVVTVVPLEP